MIVLSDVAGGKIFHTFYLPENISKLKLGMNFEKNTFKKTNYKEIVSSLIEDTEARKAFKLDLEKIKEG